MGHTACTELQCLYSRAIPLLPLWAVRPVQSLSACTVELYLYSPYGPYSLYRASVPVQGCTLPLLFTLTARNLCCLLPLDWCNAVTLLQASTVRIKWDRRTGENLRKVLMVLQGTSIKTVRYCLSVCHEGVWAPGGKAQQIPNVHYTEKELQALAV